MALGYSHPHSLAHVGARLAALGSAEPSVLPRQPMNGIFYLVGVFVVAIIVGYAFGH
jgi:hypothetical protein